MRIVKYIKRQDSGWKQAAGCSGETSINLSNEILDFLSCGMVDLGEECGMTFNIYRSDFITALSFITIQLPLYRSTSRSSELIKNGNPIFERLESSIYAFFGDDDVKAYTVTLYRRKDGRIYLKGLKQKGFTIRDFLVEMSSALEFSLTSDGFDLRLLSGVLEGDLD